MAPTASRSCSRCRSAQIFDEDRETLIHDFTTLGEKFVLAEGLVAASATRISNPPPTAPRSTNPGQEGEERWIWLRLKLIADAASSACPMPASRPSSRSLAPPNRRSRTILHHAASAACVVNAQGREFVLADLPGLIEGAHEGAGLGDRFWAMSSAAACCCT
jgi:GTP-binding protein